MFWTIEWALILFYRLFLTSFYKRLLAIVLPGTSLWMLKDTNMTSFVRYTFVRISFEHKENFSEISHIFTEGKDIKNLQDIFCTFWIKCLKNVSETRLYEDFIVTYIKNLFSDKRINIHHTVMLLGTTQHFQGKITAGVSFF